MTKPTALLVQPDALPTVLQQQSRWCLWRYHHEGTRWSKVPCMPSAAYARSNDVSTWVSFDQALVAYRAGAFDGLGFMLGDGWAGLDLDHCQDTDDAIRSRLTCYLERSPSGTGYKAIGRSHRIGGEIKFDTGTRTPWRGARFFAMTGHGSGDPTVDITAILDEWFPDRRERVSLGTVPSYIRAGDTRGTERIERLTDDQVVERVLATPQASKFMALVRGDLSAYGGDRSRADQALCSILAYWCQGDLEQVDRLFRQTKLMRPKWNSGSYRRATLAKAVQL
jgi:primase-polymerase (primpol)-like protein